MLFPGALQLLLAAFTCEYLAGFKRGFAFASSSGKQQLTLAKVLVLMLASSAPGVVLPFLPSVASNCPLFRAWSYALVDLQRGLGSPGCCLSVPFAGDELCPRGVPRSWGEQSSASRLVRVALPTAALGTGLSPALLGALGRVEATGKSRGG